MEQKRAVLGAILASRTFSRTDQLRRFLQFVCDYELSGRSSEITEYIIGVECLGKTAGYSTAEDSSVRARAHTLRQKLDEYYENEAPGDSLRISLPKGSYIPQWLEKAPNLASPSADAVTTPEVRPEPVRRIPILLLAGAFAAGFAVAAIGFLLYSKQSPKPNALLAEAWGPLARRDADVLMCFETNPYLALLPFGPGPLPPTVLKLDPPPEVYDWFKQHHTLAPSERLYTHSVAGSMPIGRTLAALALADVLHQFAVPYQAIPQSATSITAIRRRNTIWFGNPQFSTIIDRLLDGAPLTVRYEPSLHDVIIFSRAQAGKHFHPQRGGPGDEVVRAYGLLTVIPSIGAADGQQRTVVFSGTSSAGVQAAAELYSSADRLREVKELLRKEGHTGFPSAYQVVVECKTDNVRLLEFRVLSTVSFTGSKASIDQ